MSEMQFPPAGMMCVDCGCCRANIYAGNDPLCWACDAGNHGPKKEEPKAAPTMVVKNPPPCKESQAREEIRTPVVTPPAVEKPEPAKATPIPTEETMKKRVSDEIRAAIQSAPPEVKNRDLEKKYHLSSATVSVIRRGKTWSGKPAETKPRTFAKHAPKPAAPKNLIISAPSRLPGITITISGELTEAAADGFWVKLSLQQKKTLIETSLSSLLQEA